MSAAKLPTREEEIRNLIAVRAYEFWLNQGRPSGHHLVNRHEAEHEIMSCVEKARPVLPHQLICKAINVPRRFRHASRNIRPLTSAIRGISDIPSALPEGSKTEPVQSW